MFAAKTKTKAVSGYVNDDARVAPALKRLEELAAERRELERRIEAIEQARAGLTPANADFDGRAKRLLAGEPAPANLFDERELSELNDRCGVLNAAVALQVETIQRLKREVATEHADAAMEPYGELARAVVDSLARLAEDLEAERAFRHDLETRGVGNGICAPEMLTLSRQLGGTTGPGSLLDIVRRAVAARY